MKNTDIRKFQKTVWNFYKKEGRHDLPWRRTHDPYKILVSEMMLQQTQVERVIPKYRAFLKQFPTVQALAKAPLREVLKLWSGLGYNRRALYLQRTAKAVVSDLEGKFPRDAESLEKLPGIGPYTARAVATFSYGQSYIFIETNIRTVFIHAFFPTLKKVPDDKLFPLIRESLPEGGRVREWYFALMDYGSHLKKTLPNPSLRSAHHVKQSRFEGSLRQMRGEILKKCTAAKQISTKALLLGYAKADKIRAKKALSGLVRDGFLELNSKGFVTITS